MCVRDFLHVYCGDAVECDYGLRVLTRVSQYKSLKGLE